MSCPGCGHKLDFDFTRGCPTCRHCKYPDLPYETLLYTLPEDKAPPQDESAPNQTEPVTNAT